MKTIHLKTHEARAVLDGRKTMLRVPIKSKSPITSYEGVIEPGCAIAKHVGKHLFVTKDAELLRFSPYQPGDVLAVKETWTIDERGAIGSDPGYYYKADMPKEDVWKGFWKPSIHMPREACRLFLRIKSVRVERLQDISEEDAKAEGTKPMIELVDSEKPVQAYENYAPGPGYLTVPTARESFRTLWQKINGAESWNSNPWVWVVEFERIQNLNA